MKTTEGVKQNRLDETYDLIGTYFVAGDEQKIAMTLYAAATHAMRCHVTMGRMLFWSYRAESGKTLGMNLVAALSANAIDADGTSYALQGTLAAATNTPEVDIPTLYFDEISDVFGKSGLNGGGKPIAKILRKGYKFGAKDSWSVNRVSEHYSIFTPFLMTGLRTAVPSDIRTRCISICCIAGKPLAYFDVREGEPKAAMLGKSLGAEVKFHADAIKAFRARGLHSKMTGRKLEVWEPLCAVAFALGGQRWLNMAVKAFEVLALSESESNLLSPVQTTLRDMDALITGSDTLVVDGFVSGLALCDELARVVDCPLYEGRSAASLAVLINDAMKPVLTTQRRLTIKGEPVRVRGYTSKQIHDAWQLAKPEDDDDDSLVMDEYNPFEVDDAA